MGRKWFRTMFSVALAVCLMGNTVSAGELGTPETEETHEAVTDNSNTEAMDVSAGDAVQEYTAEIPAVGAATGLTYTVEGDTVTITGEGACWTYGSKIENAIKNAKHVVFRDCKIQGSMSKAFAECENLLSINLSGLDTSAVTNMRGMFYDCFALKNLDVSNLNTSQVTDMGQMFYNCIGLTSLNVRGLDTSRLTSMEGMFWNCSGVTSLDVSGFDTSNVTDMGWLFFCCSSLTSIDVSGFNTSRVTNMEGMFTSCSELRSLDVKSFDTSQVTSMEGMFGECSSLTSLDVSGFDTSQVTGMNAMFACCSELTSLDLSGFDTSQVTDMGEMFFECSNLTSLNLRGFNTSQVKYMEGMFTSCSKLTSLDVKGFDTSQVKNMKEMFYKCSKLRSLDVKGFDTSQVTSMAGMFSECSSLASLDLSGFNTSIVSEMNGMFYKCSGLTSLNVSGFDTYQLSSLEPIFEGEEYSNKGIFESCTNLKTLDLSSFDLHRVPAGDKGLERMLSGCFLKELRTPKEMSSGCSIPLGRGYQTPTQVITDTLTPEFAGTTLTVNNPVEETFADVQAGAWYVLAVQYAYDNGIMTGKTATTFAPNASLTRAEFTTVLYSQAGKPSVTYRPIFKDVEQGAWYSSPVLWAYDKGIVSGYTNGCFGTSDKITREQLALMMYKYAQMKGYDTTADADILSSFSDEAAISSWARGAIQWAASQGIMSGKGKGADGKPMLDPKGNATRAECAAMIKKLFTMD